MGLGKSILGPLIKSYLQKPLVKSAQTLRAAFLGVFLAQKNCIAFFMQSASIVPHRPSFFLVLGGVENEDF